IEAASQTGQKEMAEYLLAAGAPTGICTAAMLGLTDRVKEFLKADRALADGRGAHGIPALYHAVIRNHEDIAELLLAHGADVNLDEGKNPAIHGAVLFRQPAMVEWLIAHGAHVNAKNYEGMTPLAVAMKHENTQMADLLKRNGGTM
ncbi:MAG: ankyrin repeat domain-containing protein, partial [Chloroflexota bacterium]